MNSTATITITETDTELRHVVDFGGPFNPASVAHQHAKALGEQFERVMRQTHEAQNLSDDEVKQTLGATAQEVADKFEELQTAGLSG